MNQLYSEHCVSSSASLSSNKSDESGGAADRIAEEMNYLSDIYQGQQYDNLSPRDNMLEESNLRRLKNILTTVPKLPPWSEVVSNGDEDEIEQLKVKFLKFVLCDTISWQDLTNTFLNFISGGETGKLLGSCLNDHQKQKMFSAVSASKRSLQYSQ